MIEAGRVDNGRITLLAIVQAITPDWIAVQANVLFSRAVAGFAGDAQFAYLCSHCAGRAVNLWLSAGGVALNATHIPNVLGGWNFGVAQKGGMKGSPALVIFEPGEGKNGLDVAMLLGNPGHLHV